MKRLTVAALFFFCLLISSCNFAFADQGRPPAQPLSITADKAKAEAQAKAAEAEIDKLKIQNAVLEKTSELKREVDDVKSKFDAHDKYVDRWIATAGIIVTVLSIVIGLLAYQSRQEAKEVATEAKKEAEKAIEEARKAIQEVRAKLEKVDEMHDKVKQKSNNIFELEENIRAIKQEMEKSGVKPSGEIVDKLKQDYDNLSNEFAAMRSKVSAEKDEFSATLDKQLSALKESAQFLEKQGKPLPASHYFNLGYAAGQGGNHEDAIRYYTKAIEKNHNFSHAYNNRGVAKSNLGRHEEAIVDFDKAIQLKPDLAEAYNSRGATKGRLGRHEEAIADFDKAIELKPDYANAYKNMSEAQICHSKFGEAETTLVTNSARFVQIRDKAIVFYLLRLALVAQGKDDSKAKTDYEALFKNNPGLSVAGWDHKPIDAKLAEIERNKELSADRIAKMKAVHAEFKSLGE